MGRLSRFKALRVVPVIAFLWLGTYQACDAIEDLGEDFPSIARVDAPSGGYRISSSIASPDDDSGDAPNILGRVLLPEPLKPSELEPAVFRISSIFLQSLPPSGLSLEASIEGPAPPGIGPDEFLSPSLSRLFASSSRSLAPPVL